MTSIKWEFCALVSHATEVPGEGSNWSCRVSYFTPRGVVTRQLREPHLHEPADVFERAMAQLGAGGWELVSLQHEMVRLNTVVDSERFLATVQTGYGSSPFGVAYFKRPIEPGRAIDEPDIASDSNGAG